MTPGQARRLARKGALRQKEMLEELHALANSIAKSETLILALKEQMEAVTVKHQDRKTTSDDIAYLEDLLRCARKKLDWEKHMAGVAKRTPEVLTKVTEVMNDTATPPSEEYRQLIMRLLQVVQEGMTRLGEAKGGG